jgi:hypothetical protein
MRFNAISDEMFKLYKKHKTYLFVASAIAIFCIVFIILLITLFVEKASFIHFIAVGIVLEIFFPLSFFLLISVLKQKRAIQEIGENLIVNISNEHIILEDRIDNKSITIKHEIFNIKVAPHSFDVHYHFFLNMFKSNSGLLVIIDEQKFFKAMSDMYKKRLDPYEQRLAILESGFFIACSREDSLIIIDKLQNNIS